MKKAKSGWKIIMIDGHVQKVGSFVDDVHIDDIVAIRSWMNNAHPFVNIGNNNIINLRHVKRIKRIWRLRDHLPKFTKTCFKTTFVFFILWFMIMGYLILIGIN